MSIHDQHPTEYFGPGVRRLGIPGGGYLQVPDYMYAGILASGQFIELSPEEEIADILELANARTVTWEATAEGPLDPEVFKILTGMSVEEYKAALEDRA